MKTLELLNGVIKGCDNGLLIDYRTNLQKEMEDLRSGIKIKQPITKEYRLMYFFSAWVTSECIYAESDEEAIFDADNTPKIAADTLQYALFCGNKLIKKY